MRANKHRRKGRNTRPFFLFLKPSEREKSQQPNPQSQESKIRPREEAKQGSRTRAGRKQGKRGKERKTKGETRNKPQNRLTIHAYKSPTINAKPQTHTNIHPHPKTRQNPLKTRNKAYLKGKAGKESRKADKRRGTRHERRG